METSNVFYKQVIKSGLAMRDIGSLYKVIDSNFNATNMHTKKSSISTFYKLKGVLYTYFKTLGVICTWNIIKGRILKFSLVYDIVATQYLHKKLVSRNTSLSCI